MCWKGQLVPQQALLAEGAWQQVPPQVSVVHAAWHVPAEQACPAEQVVAQDPQWAGSVCRFTQVVPQRVKPAAQVGWQVPDAQVWPAAQVVPQDPQFRGSLETSVQTVAAPVPQTCFGERQVHVDDEQTSPAMQTFPQDPQLDALEAVSTQLPRAGSSGQNATVAGVVSQTHAAAVQAPRPQACPHVPQLAASVCLFTHCSPQVSGRVDGHVQTPAAQDEPALHCTLQSPQWRASDVRSTHVSPQAVCPAGQVSVVDVQAPATTAATSASTQPPRATDLAIESTIGRLPG